MCQRKVAMSGFSIRLPGVKLSGAQSAAPNCKYDCSGRACAQLENWRYETTFPKRHCRSFISACLRERLAAAPQDVRGDTRGRVVFFLCFFDELAQPTGPASVQVTSRPLDHRLTTKSFSRRKAIPLVHRSIPRPWTHSVPPVEAVAPQV